MQRAGDCERVGLRHVPQVPPGDERRGCQSEAHRQLLHRARDRRGHARIGGRDVGITHAVDAGELKRVEESLRQGEHDDDRQRGSRRDQREEADRRSDQDRVDDQHRAEAVAAEQPRAQEFHAHRRGRGGHRQQARLPRRQPEGELIEQWQQKGHAADSEPRDEAADDRNPERAKLEER